MIRVLAVLAAATLGAPAAEPSTDALHDAWRAAVAAGDYEEALKPSRQLLERMREHHGDDAPALVEPLQALGRAQRETGDYAGAEASFAHAIRILEGNGGIFSRALYTPFMGLGETYQQAGHHAEAETAFRRARHLIRRHDGLHDPGQIDALDALSENHFLQGEFQQAERYQLIGMRISERALGDSNPELVPPLLKLSRWYRRLDNQLPLHDLAPVEQRLNKRALSILEMHADAHDPRLIPTLRTIASSYRERNINRRAGKQALIRALTLAEGTAHSDTVTLAGILIELGDWNLQFREPEAAMDYYRRAWRLLDADADLHAVRDRRLSRPVPLYLPAYRPPDSVARWRDEPPQMRVPVEVDVDEHGEVINFRRGSVPAPLRRAASAKLRRAIFRPAIDNGEPRKTLNVRIDMLLP